MTKTCSKNCVDFINDEHLNGLVASATEEPTRVREIIAKSMNKEPLTVEETASLLAAESEPLVEEIFEAARDLKTAGGRVRAFGGRNI